MHPLSVHLFVTFLKHGVAKGCGVIVSGSVGKNTDNFIRCSRYPLLSFFFFVLHFFFCENLVSFRTSIFGVSTPIAKASLAYFLGVRVTCLNFSDPGFRKFERTEHICFSEFSKYCAL